MRTLRIAMIILCAAVQCAAGSPQSPSLTRQAENGVVTGTLRGPNGAAASGVRVAAMAIPDTAAPATGGALVSIAETDSSGQYRLENIPPGHYYIMAGLIDFPSFYPGVAAMASAKDVWVTSGASLSSMDFAMTRPPGVRVHGRIPVTAIPRPVRVLLSGGTGSSAITTINLDGTFEFLKVAPGRYTVNISPSNGVPSLTINVNDADVVVGLPPGPGVSVSGAVGLGPLSPKLPNQRVVLTGATAWSQVEALVDPQTGVFAVLNVPPGTYTVRTMPGSVNSLATLPVRDREITGLVVPAYVEITGRVQQNGGAALMIHAIRQNATVSTVVRPDGTFRLSIPEGEYRIETGQLPAGMSIDSMSYGSVNLLKEPLRLDGKSEIAEIRVEIGE